MIHMSRSESNSPRMSVISYLQFDPKTQKWERQREPVRGDLIEARKQELAGRSDIQDVVQIETMGGYSSRWTTGYGEPFKEDESEGKT